MRRLSKRQQAILACIADSVTNRGFPPTIREVCKASGLTSTSAAVYQLQILESRGYIQRLEGTARGIRILRESEIV